MKIIEKIKVVEQKGKDDPEYAAMIRNQAIDAIYKGFATPEWIAYMSNFATSIKQLARLTTTDGNDIAYVKESRAYMVSNAVCFPATTTGTGQGVHPNIDHTAD